MKINDLKSKKMDTLKKKSLFLTEENIKTILQKKLQLKT